MTDNMIRMASVGVVAAKISSGRFVLVTLYDSSIMLVKELVEHPLDKEHCGRAIWRHPQTYQQGFCYPCANRCSS
eukprot:1391045-Amphidinium_carterae.1